MPETTLGSMALAANDIIRHSSPKLRPYQGDDQLWMVTAYVFDLTRKMEYFYKAARRFADRADPQLAAEIRRDNEILHQPDLTWQQAAQELEKIVLRLWAENGEEHQQLLDRAAAKGG